MEKKVKVFDKIENISVDSIKPYWRNPRVNEKTVEALVELISKVGFNVPIVVDEELVIIKGHARLRAAKRLEMETIPCIVAKGLSDEQKRIDRIADNKVQELTKWNEEELRYEISEIDYDFSVVGIEREEIGSMVGASDWQSPTTEDIEGVQEAQSEIMQGDKEMFKFICPYCNEDFYLSKEDVFKEIRASQN